MIVDIYLCTTPYVLASCAIVLYLHIVKIGSQIIKGQWTEKTSYSLFLWVTRQLQAATSLISKHNNLRTMTQCSDFKEAFR